MYFFHSGVLPKGETPIDVHEYNLKKAREVKLFQRQQTPMDFIGSFTLKELVDEELNMFHRLTV